MWLWISLTVGIQLHENNEKRQFVMVSGDTGQRSDNLAHLRRKAESGWHSGVLEELPVVCLMTECPHICHFKYFFIGKKVVRYFSENIFNTSTKLLLLG